METKIDFEKIWKYWLDTDLEGDDLTTPMRQAAIEAIRLAAPLLLDHFDDWDDEFTIPTKQSIIDAVESVTKQIVGE